MEYIRKACYMDGQIQTILTLKKEVSAVIKEVSKIRCAESNCEFNDGMRFFKDELKQKLGLEEK